jgi:hypothetical protein
LNSVYIKFRSSSKETDGLEVTPTLAIQKLLVLARMKRWDDFSALAAGDGAFGKTKVVLDRKDAGFAADRSAELGIAFHQSGDDGTARQWLEYGITRDPNASGLNLLANLLEAKSGGRRALRDSR